MTGTSLYSLRLAWPCHLTHLTLDKMAANVSDYMFKWIFLNENGRIPFQISLKLVLMSPIDKKLALVHIMAWPDQATSHYLNQCWPSSPTHICGTRGNGLLNSGVFGDSQTWRSFDVAVTVFIVAFSFDLSMFVVLLPGLSPIVCIDTLLALIPGRQISTNPGVF